MGGSKEKRELRTRIGVSKDDQLPGFRSCDILTALSEPYKS
jgi:hypothetical protein